MEYINDLLNAKRLDVDGILHSPCTLSVKEDGCAVQVRYDDGGMQFGKRSYAPYKLTKPLTDIDMLVDEPYYLAYCHFHEKEYLYSHTLKKHDIFNFEVMSSAHQHIVKYDGAEKCKIILLSAYDGQTPVSREELERTAKALDVDCVELIETGGKLGEDVICEMEAGRSDEAAFAAISRAYRTKTPRKDLEGYVLTFDCGGKTRNYKVQNPSFTARQREHLGAEKADKRQVNCEDVYSALIERYSACSPVYRGNTKLDRLFYFWYDVKDVVSDVAVREKAGSPEAVKKMTINDIFLWSTDPRKYKLYINSMPAERALLKFVLLGFQNRRVKNPLWCSLDFQERVLNPFLDDVLFKGI